VCRARVYMDCGGNLGEFRGNLGTDYELQYYKSITKTHAIYPGQLSPKRANSGNRMSTVTPWRPLDRPFRSVPPCSRCPLWSRTTHFNAFDFDCLSLDTNMPTLRNSIETPCFNFQALNPKRQHSHLIRTRVNRTGGCFALRGRRVSLRSFRSFAAMHW
jgi:hypothetical protein